MLAGIDHHGDPRTLKEALASESSSDWLEAVYAEFAAHKDNGTWELIPRSDVPPGVKLLKSKLVFRTKYNSDSTIERRKVRLVAKGYLQREGIDYDELFAPVANLDTIRLLLALSTSAPTTVHQMDVKTAFLNPEISNELYMEVPEGLTVPMENNYVCKLRKTIYGLRQSSREWNELLNEYLLEFGLQRSQSDPCLYFSFAGSITLIVTVYVDDLLVWATTEERRDDFKFNIAQRFKMKDLGEASWILGMRIRQSAGEVWLDQEKYSNDLLMRFGMDKSRPVSTSLPIGSTLQRTSTSSQDPTLEGNDVLLFRSITGSLMYLANGTRPDISVSIGQLAKCMSAPRQSHLKAAKHVLRYICGTAGQALHFTNLVKNLNTLTGYADASWGSCPDTGRSVSGYVFLFNNAAIAWKSRLQPFVAMSTAEAEYVSFSEAVKEAKYLRNILFELGYGQTSATSILEDNQPCITIATNPITNGRTKHVAIRFHFVRENIQRKEIDIVYCPTASMVADGLTKVLPKQKAAQHNKIIFGQH